MDSGHSCDTQAISPCLAQIENANMFGVPVVVAINVFVTDTQVGAVPTPASAPTSTPAFAPTSFPTPPGRA